ncbi:MAG TPA: deoxyguanosinetriphosphate triphosphohydrolase, partial [Chromatiales bacterium]|nr:deoxyguanosinetriphosphate triphosphohydrolase [Chromatiales bacterium]
ADARSLGDVGERFLARQQPSLEAQLANVADEIAYNSHDVDDGLRAGLINVEQLCEVRLFREQYECVVTTYPDLSRRRVIHEVVRRLIDRQVSDLVDSSRARMAEAAPASIDDVRGAPGALIGFGSEMRQLNLELKRFLRKALYRHYRVMRMSAKADRVITSLFEAFMNDARLLPPEYADKVRIQAEAAGVAGRARVVADYIAGMTDRYAISEYERLFNPMKAT